MHYEVNLKLTFGQLSFLAERRIYSNLELQNENKNIDQEVAVIDIILHSLYRLANNYNLD